MSRSRLLVPLAAAPVLALLLGAANPLPRSIPLPDDFGPEGIAVGTGSTFYAGSLYDGDIYRGDLRTGAGKVFIDKTGEAAVGLKVDEAHHRLFVAGGATGKAFVYDTRDGSTVATYEFADPGSALLNDVVVTRRGAYFTDTFAPVLHKIPIGPGGRLGDGETITLSGPASVMGDFPNLNGIDATPDGKTLIVGHSSRAEMYTVDPRTGASELIQISGLTPGTPDGILLDGKTLWVVENFANRLVGVTLLPDLSAGVITSVVTNDDVDGLFRVPTTVAEFGSRLALVNGRFDLGFPPPFGPGAPPGTNFDVVVIKKP